MIFLGKGRCTEMDKKKIQHGAISFFTVFALVMIRYLYYGMQYFYQLDDYIQYHNYTAFNSNIWELIKGLGLLQARPAAGVFDVAVWSKFFPVMIVAVALISALYAGAALLLRSVLRRHFDIGWLFPVVFALLPLGFEGTYWVSASSRIVCGLFFASLAAYLLQKYFDGATWRTLLGALLLQFFAACFYEQVLVFSVALCALLALLSMREKGKRCFWGFFPVVNTGLYFFLTAIAPAGQLYSGRMETIFPVSIYYFKVFLPEVLIQIKRAFLGGGFYTIVKGFWRGASLLVQDRSFWYVLILLGLCALFCVLAWRDGTEEAARDKKKNIWITLLVGILLALAPLAPFFFIGGTWISLRATVTSFAGLALCADAVLMWLLHTLRLRKRMVAVLSSLVAFVFCVAGVSELQDYKLTNENDQLVGQAILERVDVSNPKEEIGILCVEPSYLENQNYFWHEHVHGVTESGWALTGFLQYLSGQEKIAYVTPLPAAPLYLSYNYENNRPDRFDKLYYYDGEEVLPVTLRKTGEKAFDVLLADGTLCAQIVDEDGVGRILPVGKAAL